MAVFDDTAPWPEKLKLYAHTIEWPGNVPVARKADAEAIPVDDADRSGWNAKFSRLHPLPRKPQTDGEEAVRVLEVLNACQEALNGAAPWPWPSSVKKETVLFRPRNRRG